MSFSNHFCVFCKHLNERVAPFLRSLTRFCARLFVYGCFSLFPLLMPHALEAQSIPYFRVREERAAGLFQKGLLFYHTHRYAAAREFFYKALEVQPHFHLARRYLGDSRYYSGEWEDALEQWEFLSQLSQNSYPLVKQRSQLLRFQLGHTYKDSRYVFLRSFNSKSWPGYSFRGPTDLAFGPAGEIYLNSFSSANIIALSPSGNAMKEISGPFYDSLSAPLGNASDARGNIYVSDYTEDRVRVFSSPPQRRGRELLSFGSSGSQPGQFYGPTNIVVHRNSVFVSDSGNRRIQKFNTRGRFLLEMGKNIGAEAPLHPTGLAIDKNKVLYAADRDGARILRFDLDGNFLGELTSELIKKPRGLHIHNDRLIIADEEGGILFYDLAKQNWSSLEENEKYIESSPDASLHRPSSIEASQNESRNRALNTRLVRPFAARIDRTGALYVADYGSNQVLLYVPLGMRISNLNCKIQKVDTSSFPKIALFVSIQNRLGESLGSLSRSSFRLSENDSPIRAIKTDNITPYNRSVSIALVKENSHFYTQNYEKYLQASLAKTLASLRISDSFHVIEAGKDTRLIYEGLERRKILRLLSRKENKSAEANLAKGLYEAIGRLSKRIGPRAIILLLSGKYYPKAFAQYSVSRIIQYARSHEIAIHVLSYEGEKNLEKRRETNNLYKELAQKTRGRYFRAFNEKALAGLYEEISGQKDPRYIITYSTSLSSKLKGRYVELFLELEYLGTRGLADAGYFIP